MSRKAAAAAPLTEEQEADLAWLVQPAKDLVENFGIDILIALSSYLEVIEQECDENDDRQPPAEGENHTAQLYKLFNFQRACRVLQGSCAVYAKKVDHVMELTISVLELIENRQEAEAARGGARGRGRRPANLGSTDFDLIDVKKLKLDVLQHYEKAIKEEKLAMETIRSVDSAEIAESIFERRHCLIAKPTQFMFKLSPGELNRTNEQIWNSKTRPEVIGKVKDFDVKKAELVHDQQILYSYDGYKHNIDQFTLPGARWIPDNKELATNFGVPDVEVELDIEKNKEQINAYGPFKDPLSGREVIAPPRWFIEQEATRQHLELVSRATSRATMNGGKLSTVPPRDSQPGYGSQRLSQPMLERHRSGLHELMSFVETRMNKNRPSTHLGTGLVDMIVNNFGGEDQDPFSGGGADENYDPMDYSYGGGGGGANDDDEEDDENDYVANLTRRSERRRPGPAPWDDLEKIRIPHFSGEEDIPTSRKPVKVLSSRAPIPIQEALRRKRRREATKAKPSRRDEFMETHDYLQDYYYWRSAARINPDKDWKVESLRSMILAEKKRRVREKTAKIREIRAQNLNQRRRPIRQPRGIPVEEYEAVMDDVIPQTNRRTMGAEYDDIVDEDLAAEVEMSILGGGGVDGGGGDEFDDYDIQPIGEGGANYDYDGGAAAESAYKPMRFEDIDDDDLNDVINLPGDLFIDRAIPILKKFSESKSDREKMAYQMAKAYEDVDVAVSTLQEHVDKWHARMEPILEEGETRKEYDVHEVGRKVLSQFIEEQETHSLIDLVVARPWFEISRYFLSCLFMCNLGNVMITDDKELSLEDKINTMRITLLSHTVHKEQFKKLAEMGKPAAAVEAEAPTTD